MLAELFPRLTFVLYDDHFEIESIPDRIVLNLEYLTTKEQVFQCREVDRALPMLFISDIRTSETGKRPTRSNIENDNILQMELVKALQPTASMFKFRTPYVNHCDYKKGFIFLYFFFIFMFSPLCFWFYFRVVVM
jgi:hypothetical protein